MIEQLLNKTLVLDLPNNLKLGEFSLSLHQSHKLKIRTYLIDSRLSTLCSLNKNEYILINDDYLGGCVFNNNSNETIAALSYYEYNGSIECKLFIFE